MGQSIRQRIEDAATRLADIDTLSATLERMVEDGELSRRQADDLLALLPSQIEDSRYVLRHLGAHLVIGAVFAFDVIPLPLGTISRVSWVAGSRIVESVRRQREHARVHSVGVFAIAAIPLLGYAAYLHPLRRDHRELAFVLANHTWLTRTGRTYERALAEAWTPLRRVGRWLVRRPEESGPS